MTESSTLEKRVVGEDTLQPRFLSTCRPPSPSLGGGHGGEVENKSFGRGPDRRTDVWTRVTRPLAVTLRAPLTPLCRGHCYAYYSRGGAAPTSFDTSGTNGAGRWVDATNKSWKKLLRFQKDSPI